MPNASRHGGFLSRRVGKPYSMGCHLSMRKPVVERVLHGSAGFPQVGKRPFGTPWWWCSGSGALLSRVKVLGIGWGQSPYLIIKHFYLLLKCGGAAHPTSGSQIKTQIKTPRHHSRFSQSKNASEHNQSMPVSIFPCNSPVARQETSNSHTTSSTKPASILAFRYVKKNRNSE